MADLFELLNKMVEKSASDLFITVGAKPTIKIKKDYVTIGDEIIDNETAKKYLISILSDKQIKEFQENNEINFAIDYKDVGRFRISGYIQKSKCAIVVRAINSHIPKIKELGLPPILEKLALANSGLIIIAGAAGVGKSTTLASMIDYRNSTTKGHIFSIEDPIEYIHTHKMSIVSQREVGDDTESFEIGLKNSLRQTPDVIIIGEIRSKEVMQHAIHFAESGHLCLATIHASTSYQTLDRIVNFFDSTQRNQILNDLSMCLRAIICQQLIPKVNPTEVVPAVEILLNTLVISDRIKRGEFSEIKEFIQKSAELGMVTMDQSLIQLYKNGIISEETAISRATSENDVRLQIKFSKPADKI